MGVVTLRDRLGVLLAEFEMSPGTPMPRAASVWFTEGHCEQIVDAVGNRFVGHQVAVFDRGDVAEGLLARGGVPGRHSLVMTLDLTGRLPAASVSVEVSIGPMVRTRTAEYGAVLCRAYPPDHPDYDPGDADPRAAASTVDSYLRGEEVGAWIPEASLEAADPGGRVMGAIVISEVDANLAFTGGPWITDVFVDPEFAGLGIGGALIAQAATRLAAQGRPSLGLAVTASSPARRLYERMGYVTRHEIWQIAVPA
jgi:GNAT superfamily N-acetyltransferase